MRFACLLLVFFQCFIAQGNEHKFLTNIRQLTFTEMGFERAGEGYFSSDGSQIIFQAVPVGETNYQMYVMSLNDRNPLMVSTGRGACTCGFFHPNGKKIIFASSHDSPLRPEKRKQRGRYTWELTPYMNIYEANLNGSELRPLTQGSAYHAECAYSSDGKKIVYASNQDGSMNIYVMDADGHNVQQITYNLNCYNGGTFFSPDGTKIIFRSDREERHLLQIYMIDIDGTNEVQLTHNTAVNWAPYWHPDGIHVAFTKSLPEHTAYELFLLNVETGRETRITYGNLFDGLPVFSPDGKKLMWTSKRGDGKSCQLFIADFYLYEGE